MISHNSPRSVALAILIASCSLGSSFLRAEKIISPGNNASLAASGSTALSPSQAEQDINQVESKATNNLSKLQQDSGTAAGLLDANRPLDLNDIKTKRAIKKDAAQEKHDFHQGKKLLTQDQQQANQEISDATQQETAAKAAKKTAKQTKDSLVSNDKNTKGNVAAALSTFKASLPDQPKIANFDNAVDSLTDNLASDIPEKPDAANSLKKALSKEQADAGKNISAKKILKDQKKVDQGIKSLDSTLDAAMEDQKKAMHAFSNKEQLHDLVKQRKVLVKTRDNANQAYLDAPKNKNNEDAYDIAKNNLAIYDQKNAGVTNYSSYVSDYATMQSEKNIKTEIKELVATVEGNDLHQGKKTLQSAVQAHKTAHDAKISGLAAATTDYGDKKADYKKSKEALAADNQDATDLSAAQTSLKATHKSVEKQVASANASYNQWGTNFDAAFKQQEGALQATIDNRSAVVSTNSANTTNNIAQVESKAAHALDRMQQKNAAAAGLLADNHPLDLNDIKMKQSLDKSASQEKREYHQGTKALNLDQAQADTDFQNAQTLLTNAITARAPIHQEEKSLSKKERAAQQAVLAAQDAVNQAQDQNSSDLKKDQKALKHDIAKEQELAREEGVAKSYDAQAKAVVDNAKAVVATATTEKQNVTNAQTALQADHTSWKEQKNSAVASYRQWSSNFNTGFNNSNTDLQTGITQTKDQLNNNASNVTNQIAGMEGKAQQAYSQLQQDRIATAGLLDPIHVASINDITKNLVVMKDARQEKHKYHQGEKALNLDQQQASSDLQQAQASLAAAVAARSPIHQVEKSLGKKEKRAQQAIITDQDAVNQAQDQNSSDLKKDQNALKNDTAKEQELAREQGVAKADDNQAKITVNNAADLVATATTTAQNIQNAKQSLVDTDNESKAERRNAHQSYNQLGTEVKASFKNQKETLQNGTEAITPSIENNATTVANNDSDNNKKGTVAVTKMQRLAAKINDFLTSNPSFNSQDDAAMNKAIAKNDLKTKKAFHQADKLAAQDQQQAAVDVQAAQANLNNVRTTLDPIHQAKKSLEKEDKHAQKAVAAAQENVNQPVPTSGEVMSLASVSSDKKLNHEIAKEQQIAKEVAIVTHYNKEAKAVVTNAEATLNAANAEMQAANNEANSIADHRSQWQSAQHDAKQNINSHVESNGDYYDKNSGTLYYTFNSEDDSPRLLAKKQATIAGPLVASFANGTPSVGSEYAFIAAPNVSGGFSNIEMPTGTRGRIIIVGDPTVFLLVAPESYAQEATSKNQVSVAQALNSFIPATAGDELTVSTALDLLTPAEYPTAFNQITPALYSSFATMAFNNAVAQYNEMVQRLGNIRVAGVGFRQSGFNDSPIMDDSKNPKASEKDILIPSVDNHWGVFVDGNGIFANVNINNQLPGYSVESGGVTVGASYQWNETFSSGIYAGYEGAQSKQSDGNFICDNGSRFGVFGTYQKGGLFGNALLGGDSHSYQVNRTIQFPGVNRTATSTPTAGELDSMLVAGYDVKRGNFTFGPITSLQYTYLGIQPFTEAGAQSLDLSVGDANANSLVYSLGAHCFYNCEIGKNILLLPQINLGWQHEFLQNPYALNSTLPNGASFTTMTTTPLRDSLYTGVGMTIEIAKKYDASFFYNASAANPSLISQNFFLSLGAKF